MSMPPHPHNNWTQPEEWTVGRWLLAALLFAAGSAVVASQCACSPSNDPPITAVEARELTNHGATLHRCEGEGRKADSFRVYEACLKDGGIE